MTDLDHQYSPSRWSHRMNPEEVIQAHVRTLTEGSELAKSTIDCEVGRSYGLSEKEKFDVFGASTLPGEAPIFVYIHGGYWAHLSLEMSSFMAPLLCRAGAVVVAIGYELAPNIDMPGIVSQVKKAVSFVLTMATRRGSSGVYLCGHSAGGHLAAMMLTTNWMEECMVSPSLIRGAVLVSGIYDLTPLISTYVNEPLKMTQNVAMDNSPVLHLDQIVQFSGQRRLIVAFGDHDSPEFQRQSMEFNNKLLEHGVNSTMVIVPDCDHFNVIENLDKHNFMLTQEVLKLMCLNIDTLVDKMGTTDIS